MKHGRVKWFNNVMKYGFITGDDGMEYFVHFSEISGAGYKTLGREEPVNFETETTPRGPKAVRVERLSIFEGKPK